MPKIKPKETRNEYIPRCINYVMKYEGLGKDAAVGKCEGLYDQHEKKKNKKAKGENLLNDMATNIIKIYKSGDVKMKPPGFKKTKHIPKTNTNEPQTNPLDNDVEIH